MKQYACTEEQFLADVAQHTMTVLRDDGVHRHIRFKRPNESAYWFDFITWPGSLCIDGDMGTYVFRRLDDMFQFFRTDRDSIERRNYQLAINPGYWSEKLTAAANCRESVEKFDTERFRKIVKEHFDQWVEYEEPSETAKAEVWAEIEDQVLSHADDGEIRAVDAAIVYSNEEYSFMFNEFWENNLKSYTFCFIWCCYAIAWGIENYDAAKASTEAA